MAQQVWQDLGISLPMVGIAKGPERKAGQEELIIPHLAATMQLPPHHPALHLLQIVCDESQCCRRERMRARSCGR